MVTTSLFQQKLLWRFLLSILLILGAVSWAGWEYREDILVVTEGIVEKAGLIGVFCSVLVIDWFPFPASNEPVVFVAYTGGIPILPLYLITSIASVLAGILAYSGGRALGRYTSIGQRLRTVLPKTTQWIARHGAWATGLAAVLPLPYSVFCWIAGISRVNGYAVCLTCLLRFLKTAFYLWLMVMGWSLT